MQDRSSMAGTRAVRAPTTTNASTEVADGAAALPLEAVLKAPTLAAFSPPPFSPDGRFVAYVVIDNSRRRATISTEEIMRSGLAWHGVCADVWVVDLETGEQHNITGARGHNWAPSWSPDGTQLAFLSDRSGAPEIGPARLWTWDRVSQQLRQSGDADVRDLASGTRWIDPGVLVSLFPADLGRDGYVSLVYPSATEPAPETGVTARVFEFDASSDAVPETDQINLDLWLRDVGVVDAATGTLRTLVKGLRVAHYEPSPDGKQVAYAVLTGSDDPGSGRYRYDIRVLDLASDQTRTVAQDIHFSLYGNTFSWSPAGDQIAWRTAGPTVPDEVHVVPVTGGAPRRLAGNPPLEDLDYFDVEPPIWDAKGERVYFVRDRALWCASIDGAEARKFATLEGYELGVVSPRQHRLLSPDGGRSAVVWATDRATKRAGLARVDLSSGAVTLIYEADERYGGYGTEPTISHDGASIAYVAEDPTHPPDVYVRRDDLTEARKVTEVAPELAGRTLGRAEIVDWQGLDGETHHGALVYPAGYHPGMRYPLIVVVYGGSEISKYMNCFGFASSAFENLQLFATRGYALLLADSKLRVGTPMVDLMKTVMPGINKAVEIGLADPDSIGVTGHSYGGYSSLSLIAQSPRFKAAVMRAGMGDMIGSYGHLAPDGTNYGLAWAESGQGRMGGSPWEVRERYLENSPIFYLDRVETPLLIIHGTKDDAVPVFLADQVFTGLRRLGKTVSYARYDGESRWEGMWSPANQIDVLRRIIDWFDRHLKGPKHEGEGS